MSRRWSLPQRAGRHHQRQCLELFPIRSLTTSPTATLLHPRDSCMKDCQKNSQMLHCHPGRSSCCTSSRCPQIVLELVFIDVEWDMKLHLRNILVQPSSRCTHQLCSCGFISWCHWGGLQSLSNGRQFSHLREMKSSRRSILDIILPTPAFARLHPAFQRKLDQIDPITNIECRQPFF